MKVYGFVVAVLFQLDAEQKWMFTVVRISVSVSRQAQIYAKLYINLLLVFWRTIGEKNKRANEMEEDDLLLLLCSFDIELVRR